MVKPDQLIKRRGKLGLIAVGVDFATAKDWVDARMNKDQKVSVILLYYNALGCFGQWYCILLVYYRHVDRMLGHDWKMRAWNLILFYIGF